MVGPRWLCTEKKNSSDKDKEGRKWQVKGINSKPGRDFGRKGRKETI